MILDGSFNDRFPGFVFRSQIILDVAIREKKIHTEFRMGNDGIVETVKTGQLLKTADIMKQADETGNIAFLIRKLQSLAEIKTGIHYMEGMAQLQVDLRVCEIKAGCEIEEGFCIFPKIRFQNRRQRRKIIRFHKNSFLNVSSLIITVS